MNVYINGKEYNNQFGVNLEPICYFDYDSNSIQVEEYILKMWNNGKSSNIKLPRDSKLTFKNKCLFIEYKEN